MEYADLYLGGTMHVHTYRMQIIRLTYVHTYVAVDNHVILFEARSSCAELQARIGGWLGVVLSGHAGRRSRLVSEYCYHL